MKKLIVSILVLAALLPAAGDARTFQHEGAAAGQQAWDAIHQKHPDKPAPAAPGKGDGKNLAPVKSAKSAAAIASVVGAYLRLKGALAADNGKDAASAGTDLKAALEGLDRGQLSAEGARFYDEVREGAVEHATHIAANAEKIAHQREHFQMLSSDMIDLVETLGASDSLFVDFCPMYGSKGATWLSEVKEIRNPYFGKKMPSCGTVKRVLR